VKTLTVHRIGGHLAARVQADFGVDVPVQFESNEYYLVLTQMAAYPTSAFGHRLGDLLSFEDEISNALDRLFWGF